MIIAELSGKAEMLIRTEGYRNYSQGQRIDILKIIFLLRLYKS